MKIKFELINAEHTSHKFDCGTPALNTYLTDMALLNHERRLSATTVALEDDGASKEICGYYTICPTHIYRESLPKKFGGNLPDLIPAIRFARLAVDINHQGKHIGTKLLAHALKKCYFQSVEFGGYLVVIDVKDDHARKFYEHFGIFKIIRENPLLLGIKTKDIAAHFTVASPIGNSR